jgi:hypothetical protein
MPPMTLRQDSQALSAYRHMLRELGVDVDRLSDASVIDALRRASESYMKVEEDVAQKVREACRGARARLMRRAR